MRAPLDERSYDSAVERLAPTTSREEHPSPEGFLPPLHSSPSPPLYLLLCISVPNMASEQKANRAAESGAPGGGEVGLALTTVKRGRGRPRGSRNRATLAREAAVKAAAEGAAPTPPVAVVQPRQGGVKLFDNDLPVREFVVPFTRDCRSRLVLPVPFVLIFRKYIHGSATVRDASPQQQSWRVKTEWDGDGRIVLAEGWRSFVSHYRIHPDSILLFRHREGTSDFVVRIFTRGVGLFFRRQR